MALSIDLLHEQHRAALERRRDPLKLGLLAALVAAAGLLVYYFSVANAASAAKSEVRSRQAELGRLAPELEKAKTEQEQLKEQLEAANALRRATIDRVRTAPILERVLRKVRQDIQLVALDVFVPLDGEIAVSVEGTSVGFREEPRIIADAFRQLLEEQLRADYGNASITLDNATQGAPMTIGDQSYETASFLLAGTVAARKPAEEDAEKAVK